MKTLNNYINEAWSGVKQHTNIENIKDWCEEIGIRNYTINSKGEIDVNGRVDLSKKDFKELPYKFGKVTGYFSLDNCKNLISLKNCPDYVGSYFSLVGCTSLDSLEGCPKKIVWKFYCYDCKRRFTEEEIMSLCNVKKINIVV